MTTETATTNKPDVRARDMSTQTVYEAVEGIVKERAKLFRRGRSTATVKGLFFKGGLMTGGAQNRYGGRLGRDQGGGG